MAVDPGAAGHLQARTRGWAERKIGVRFIAALWVAWVVSGAPATQPGDVPTSAPSERFAERLGSPRWAERRAAAEALVERGRAAYPDLKRVFQRSRSYEARYRIRQVVQQIYVESALGPAPAFLGIQYGIAPGRPDARSPEGTDPVRIGDVISGTAAEAAGLRPGDLIVRLNGEFIRKIPEGRAFGIWVAKQMPGATCELTVYRGERLLKITVVLGRRPWHLGTGRLEDAERSRGLMREFSGWWAREFDPQGVTSTDVPSDEDPRWQLRPMPPGT